MLYLDGPVYLAHTLMHDGCEWFSQHYTLRLHNDWCSVTVPIADSSGDWLNFYVRKYRHIIEFDDDGYTFANKELSAGDVSRVEERFGVDIHDGIVKKRTARNGGEGFVLFVQALVVCDTLSSIVS